MCSLENRRHQRDHITTFQYLKETYKKEGEGIFARVDSNRTKGNSFKLKERNFRLEKQEKFLLRE